MNPASHFLKQSLCTEGQTGWPMNGCIKVELKFGISAWVAWARRWPRATGEGGVSEARGRCERGHGQGQWVRAAWVAWTRRWALGEGATGEGGEGGMGEGSVGEGGKAMGRGQV